MRSTLVVRPDQPHPLGADVVHDPPAPAPDSAGSSSWTRSRASTGRRRPRRHGLLSSIVDPGVLRLSCRASRLEPRRRGASERARSPLVPVVDRGGDRRAVPAARRRGPVPSAPADGESSTDGRSRTEPLPATAGSRPALACALRRSRVAHRPILGAAPPDSAAISRYASAPRVVRAVRKDGPTGGRRLGEPDRPRDRGLTTSMSYVAAIVSSTARAVLGAPVVQRRQHAHHLEVRVGVAAYVVDRVEQLTNSAVRQRLALQRDHHRVGGRQRRHREHAERGRAVEQDPVVVVAARPRAPLAARARGPVGSAARSPRRPARSWPAAGRARPRSAGSRLGLSACAQQHLMQRRVELLGVDAERERQAGLRVQVDQQHALVAEVDESQCRARRPWWSWRRRPSGWRPRVWWSSRAIVPLPTRPPDLAEPQSGWIEKAPLREMVGP